MAIIKADANVQYLEIGENASGDDVIYAKVNFAYQNDATDPNTELNRFSTVITVTNASSSEITAAKSLVTKAIALAVS
jgi:hypothetical protein